MFRRKTRVSYQKLYPFSFEIALFLLYQLRNRQVRNFAPLLVLLYLHICWKKVVNYWNSLDYTEILNTVRPDDCYSETPLYEHLIITDSLGCPWGKKALDCEQPLFFFRFSELSAPARERLAPSVTRVVICVSRAFCSTDKEKRETARSLESRYIFSKLNLFNTDAPLTWALSMAPSVSVLGAFDCTFYSRPLCYTMGSSLGKYVLFLVRPTASFFPRHWLCYMGIGFSIFVVFICTDSFE